MAEGAVAHLAAFHDVADAGASAAGVEAFAPASDAIGGEAASPSREGEPGGAATAPAAFGEAAPLMEAPAAFRPWETATAGAAASPETEAQDTIHLAIHDAAGDLPADMVGEAQPLPSWAEAVASGAVSAIPELDKDLAAAKAAAADLAEAELAAARPGVAVAPGLAALRRTAFWRAAALVLAGAGLGLGGFLAYREWIAPPAGEWVAVLQAEPQPAITVRIDPARGMLHVRAFTPLVTAGEVYRLWLVPRGQQAMLLGSFAARFAGRAPALARLGVGGLGTSEVLVTREKDTRPDPAAAGPDAADVVYRGRLYPE
ncbi:hypothetical protein V5F59_18585 [Xanthobacter autotrophicus DSM 431]|uniref:hypothetical protein n=1 Tax=Xanthobacter nonsaccharivorans TaxID=3119912 RepID=UPI00372BD8C3